MAPSRPRTRKKKRPAGIAAKKERAMRFVSFVGRMLFVSIFLLSAFLEISEFGSDGGPAAKALEPKLNLFIKHVSTYTGMAVPHLQIKIVVAATLYIRVFGVFHFMLYSSWGAYLLIGYLAFITPVMYDFYNYEKKSPEFLQLLAQFLQNLSLYGALFFFLGMKSSIPMRH